MSLHSVVFGNTPTKLSQKFIESESERCVEAEKNEKNEKNERNEKEKSRYEEEVGDGDEVSVNWKQLQDGARRRATRHVPKIRELSEEKANQEWIPKLTLPHSPHFYTAEYIFLKIFKLKYFFFLDILQVPTPRINMRQLVAPTFL